MWRRRWSNRGSEIKKKREERKEREEKSKKSR